MTAIEEVRPGSVLAGRYELLSVLGRGGMGIVFRARHTGTERAIAVKVLRRELMADPTLAKRFMREAKAAAAIQHPNVVDVLDYGVDTDGTAYQVLELLEGASLGEQLASKGKLPVDVTLSLVLPVMHALAVAHGRGVIHRDLKPDNVFLARNAHGRIVPKLLDFGIAKLMRKSGAPTSTLATRVGTAIGTPAYMSPEQARGTSDVGTTTDVWAIGVILFECLTGRIPFEAETGSILMARIIMEQAPSILTIAPDTPAPLASVIDCALMAKSEDRWPTMAEFADALRDAAAECGVVITPAGASDMAPMSLPPPRTDAERELFSDGPISSGDELESPHPATRELMRPRTALTQAAVPAESPEEEGPPAKGPASRRNFRPAADSQAETPAASSPAPSRRVPTAVALVSLLLVLVFVGLWMRQPSEVAVATPEPAPPPPTPVAVAAPPPPAIEEPPPAPTAPTTPPPEEVLPVGTDVPSTAEPDEESPRDHRRRPPVHPPVVMETTPPDRPQDHPHAPGDQLPALTEW